MFYNVHSREFDSALEFAGDHRCFERIVPMDTVREWANKLVESRGEAVRLHGGWEFFPGKKEAHNVRVFLIRVGEEVYGYAHQANARRSDGKGWRSDFITLTDLKRYHREVYKVFEKSDLPTLIKLAAAPKGLDQTPKVDQPLNLTCGLDLV
jgi:hypothetical protein